MIRGGRLSAEVAAVSKAAIAFDSRSEYPVITTRSTPGAPSPAHLFAWISVLAHRPACAAVGGSARASFPGSPGTASSLLGPPPGNRSGDPKRRQQRPLAGGAPGALFSTEPVITWSRRPRRWRSIANRWASSWTRCSSCERLGVGRRGQAASSGRGRFLEALASPTTAVPRSANGCRARIPASQLALAAVDHDQRGQRTRSSRRACASCGDRSTCSR